MSCTIVISLLGLSEAAGDELARRAVLAGAPFTLRRERRRGILSRTTEVRLSIELVDLESDPSIASESLDFEHGWPNDPHVRAWLGRAMRFLGENAPEGEFAFSAGWNEHVDQRAVALDLERFLERIAAGDLSSDERYDVSRAQHGAAREGRAHRPEARR